MSDDEPAYRVYRSPAHPGRSDRERRPAAPGGVQSPAPPYTRYRANPKGLRERLRGEEASADERRGQGGNGGRGSDGSDGGPGEQRTPWWRRRITPVRVLKWVVGFIVFWLVLSAVLFVISAQSHSGGSIPGSAQRALTSGGNMLTSTDTVLVLGTDQRPKGSREPGANTSDKGSRTDTMMLWRIGGGTSRRLSIPRDTVAAIPGYGTTKINAAYAYGGPALAIRTVEQFTGVKINHVIVVNLANFPKFIDDVGGIDVKTGRICSNISGGARNGGFTLDLAPGVHHLNGHQALTLARTRHNACNAASSDLTREGYQQKILNAIKSQLLTPGTFFALPWAAWDAPQAVRTDMGGFTLLSLFAAAEMGGSAPTRILTPTGSETLPDGEQALVASPGRVRQAVHRLMHG